MSTWASREDAHQEGYTVGFFAGARAALRALDREAATYAERDALRLRLRWLARAERAVEGGTVMDAFPALEQIREQLRRP